MREMLDSNLLRCFLSVLEHRKLTTAADELCVTQPALSKSLKRLEDELGVPLFQRTPSGMVPTTYGISLGRRARQIHLESLGARSELQLMREGGYGSLIIGIGPMWSVHAFPRVVADIMRNHPKTHVKVISGVLDTLLPRLLKGELDVVIASLDFPDHPDLVKDHIIDTEHVIVGHESHPLTQLEYVSPSDLLDHPFVGFADDYAGISRMDKFFASHGIQSPGLAVESSSLELLLSLLSLGDFLASFSAPILRRSERYGIKRINLPDSFWRFAVGAVYRRGSTQSAPVTSLVQALRQHLKETESDAL
ncbi:DNA-binding transcriptional regulator, LysR family [Propionivibrio dicarboxylicus]|uniref:DNA-binding transcriptional regulator, LysR family n=2 Tax=Propionivibrio dicarboxylicus TaxID=83767 RepID=A0A1G8K1R0_9RHOO|nr:DNA-binding transcriptional regulator, LysR family [Propionivibrio dicarboxylicus]